MKQTITVMGMSVTVNTSSTDPKYVHDVAKHVDDVARKIAANCPPMPREKLAVLTALEISDELFRNLSSALPEGRRPEARIEALVERINQKLENR